MFLLIRSQLLSKSTIQAHPHSLFFCGYGSNHSNKSMHQIPSRLQQAYMEEYRGEMLYRYLFQFNCSTNRHVLVVDANLGTRKGDSGSPLFQVDERNNPLCLHGVATRSHLEDTKFLSVFERVSYYKEWIEFTCNDSLTNFTEIWLFVEPPIKLKCSVS